MSLSLLPEYMSVLLLLWTGHPPIHNLFHREGLIRGPRASRLGSHSGWLSPVGSLGSRREPFAHTPPSPRHVLQTHAKPQGPCWLSSECFRVLFIQHNSGTWVEICRIDFFHHLNNLYPSILDFFLKKACMGTVLSNVSAEATS